MLPGRVARLILKQGGHCGFIESSIFSATDVGASDSTQCEDKTVTTPWVRLALIAFFVVTLGCTSTLMAVTGRYAYYEVVEGEVVYFSWNPMSQRHSMAVLKGADPTTFSAINSSHGSDASRVFKKSLPITHADPATFTLWSGGYAADATQVFYGRIRLPGADLSTFERLGDGWARDARNIYLGSRRLDVCDLETFEIIPRSRGKDAKCYYAEANRVPIRDRASLEVLSGGYAKDNAQVYWLDRVIPGADAASFEVRRDSPSSIARDAQQCFGGPRRVTCDELNAEGQAFCHC